MALVSTYQRNQVIKISFWKRPITLNCRNSAKEKKDTSEAKKETQLPPSSVSKPTTAVVISKQPGEPDQVGMLWEVRFREKGAAFSIGVIA